MNLRSLEAELFAHVPNGVRYVDTLAEAQGVMFLCPKCYQTNGGDIGTHMVMVFFADRGVPADAKPGPGRWQVSGTSIDDLTLSPSINLDCGPEPRGCCWHGWVKNGDAV